jgi:hypothetical protein
LTITETAEELRSMARAADDGRGYFPALYSRVTDAVAAAGLAERLAVTFASYYVRAFRGEIEAPRCWQASWDVAGDGSLLIVQHLLLGINAHVNHDLPLAVVDVAREVGGLQAIKADFDAINDVLATTYKGVLRDLDGVARWTSEASALGGGRLFNFSLRVARAQAWDAAVRLFPLDDAAAADYRAELDRLVTVLAYLVTRPALPARLLLPLARRLEQHDPRTVTAALLGPRR